MNTEFRLTIFSRVSVKYNINILSLTTMQSPSFYVNPFSAIKVYTIIANWLHILQILSKRPFWNIFCLCVKSSCKLLLSLAKVPGTDWCTTETTKKGWNQECRPLFCWSFIDLESKPSVVTHFLLSLLSKTWKFLSTMRISNVFTTLILLASS